MARKKISRISCGCKGKEASGGMKDKTHIGRNCHCNIDTPKGKSIQVSEAKVDWIVFS